MKPVKIILNKAAFFQMTRILWSLWAEYKYWLT